MRVDRSVNKELQNKINRSLIFQLIRKSKGISRADIARNLSLSPSAVTRSVDWFLESKYIEEGSKEISGRVGKRAAMLYLNSQLGQILCLDFSEGEYTALLMDYSGKLVEQRCYGIIGGKVEELIHTLQTISKDWSGEQIRAVGLGVPAEISPQTGKIISLSLYKDWHDLKIRELALDIFKTEAFAEKDVFLSALGEQQMGGDYSRDNMVYLEISRGFSAAIISNGQLIRGKNGTAGQLAFSIIDEESLGYYNGTKGYLDDHADFRKLTTKRDGTYWFHPNGRKKGSVLSIQSSVIANLILTVNPEVIVFGGMIWRMEDASENYLPRLRTATAKLIPVSCPPFRISTLKGQAVSHGLTRLVLDGLLNREFPYTI